MNGRPGDHPLTDILVHNTQVFSEKADKLIREIVTLGGLEQLESEINLLVPPPLPELEKALDQIYRDLKTETRRTTGEASVD